MQVIIVLESKKKTPAYDEWNQVLLRMIPIIVAFVLTKVSVSATYKSEPGLALKP